MKSLLQPMTSPRVHRLALVCGAVVATLLVALQAQAYPIGTVTFKDDAPFMGANTNIVLTSGDGLLSVAGWADTNATVLTNLYQWWWIFGVNSGVGNGALIDGQESMTLQFDNGVGASKIVFLYTGGTGGSVNLARISIAGFTSDPGAYAITANAPRISNLAYAGGTLSFDYLDDAGGDYGQLLFSKTAASGGRTLKITGALSPNGNATGWAAALFGASWQEAFGRPTVTPVNVRDNFTNSYTTPDGGLTVRAYANSNAVTPANFGCYLDQCFGVYGAANNGAIDTAESMTLQFASGFGLARLDSVYSGAPVMISGFTSDPGLTAASGTANNVTYAAGTLTFTPADGGYHWYAFTNRAASAGRTLRINVNPEPTNYFAIAAIDYVDLHTLVAADIPSDVELSHTTPDGLLTVSAYSDTPGTTAAYLHENVDWFGILGGNNNEAIDGTESLNLQFSGAAGLSGFGTRYTSGGVVISGFAADPGFSDPSGTATGVSYSGGTLSFTYNSYRAPEVVFKFADIAASAGRTLSMHTDGLAGSQIALTRINYATAPVELSINKYGNDVVLTWPTGTLQQSTNVVGTYTDIGSATSPYTNTISGPQKFFRVKVQ